MQNNLPPDSAIDTYTVKTLTAIHSKLLGRDTIIDIYLPPGYAKEKAYPLLLLNDGQDGVEIKLLDTLNRMVSEKQLREIIVVGVHAGDRLQEYGVASRADYKGRGSRAKNYTRFIITELIPYLHYEYGISTNANDHVVAGFSLGGLSALDIAWNHSDYFKKVGAFSGAFWWRKRDANSRFFSEYRDRIMHQQIRRGRHKPGMKFWFQTGTRDEAGDRNKNGVIDSIDDTLDLIVELTKLGYRPFHDIQYVEIEGGEHNLKTWRETLPLFLEWAFKR